MIVIEWHLLNLLNDQMINTISYADIDDNMYVVNYSEWYRLKFCLPPLTIFISVNTEKYDIFIHNTPRYLQMVQNKMITLQLLLF